jgi:serine/threonine protein kinase
MNQYEVVRVIGHGCIGKTYHVRDATQSKSESNSPQLEYALKTYPGDLLPLKATKSSQLNKDLLATEIQLLSRLKHPNIIALAEVM